MSLRDIKAAARRDLHNAMQVPASYYETPASTPVLVHIRVHTKWLQQGDLKGTNFNYAETEDTSPRVLFDRDEVANPPRGCGVVISGTEGYWINHTEPPDGMTITASVFNMSADDLAGKILPEDL